MAGREAAVCGRLREFRSLIDLSRTAFAKRAGVDISALVRYEHRRAVLKYGDASRLIRTFCLNPEWLATGTGSPMSPISFDDSAFTKQTQFGALFTAIYDKFILPELQKLRAELERLKMLYAAPPRKFRAERLGHSAKLQAHVEAMREKLALRQEQCGKLAARLNAMRKDVESRELDCLKIESHISLIRKTFGGESDQAYWAKIRAMSAAMRRAQQGDPPKDSKLNVDTLAAPATLASVTSETGYWKALVDRVRALTSAPSEKARLARELNTTRQAVNKWLSGKGAASAEITLRLLRWVQQQEQKPNTLGDAINTTKGKTQVRKSSYEKQTQVHKKR